MPVPAVLKALFSRKSKSKLKGAATTPSPPPPTISKEAEEVDAAVGIPPFAPPKQPGTTGLTSRPQPDPLPPRSAPPTLTVRIGEAPRDSAKSSLRTSASSSTLRPTPSVQLPSSSSSSSSSSSDSEASLTGPHHGGDRGHHRHSPGTAPASSAASNGGGGRRPSFSSSPAMASNSAGSGAPRRSPLTSAASSIRSYHRHHYHHQQQQQQQQQARHRAPSSASSRAGSVVSSDVGGRPHRRAGSTATGRSTRSGASSSVAASDWGGHSSSQFDSASDSDQGSDDDDDCYARATRAVDPVLAARRRALTPGTSPGARARRPSAPESAITTYVNGNRDADYYHYGPDAAAAASSSARGYGGGGRMRAPTADSVMIASSSAAAVDAGRGRLQPYYNHGYQSAVDADDLPIGHTSAARDSDHLPIGILRPAAAYLHSPLAAADGEFASEGSLGSTSIPASSDKKKKKKKKPTATAVAPAVTAHAQEQPVSTSTGLDIKSEKEKKKKKKKKTQPALVVSTDVALESMVRNPADPTDPTALYAFGGGGGGSGSSRYAGSSAPPSPLYARPSPVTTASPAYMSPYCPTPPGTGSIRSSPSHTSLSSIPSSFAHASIGRAATPIGSGTTSLQSGGVIDSFGAGLYAGGAPIPQHRRPSASSSGSSSTHTPVTPRTYVSAPVRPSSPMRPPGFVASAARAPPPVAIYVPEQFTVREDVIRANATHGIGLGVGSKYATNRNAFPSRS